MPIAKVKLSDGHVVTLEVPEGTTAEQVTQFVTSQLPPLEQPVLDPKDDASAPRNAPRPKLDRPRNTMLDAAARFLEMNPVSRFARGAAQPLVGATQAAANLTPWADNVNRFVSEEERGYQALRKADGQTGADLANMGGQAATYVASLGRLAPFKTAGMAGRAGNAAVQGGAAGATQTVQGAEEGGGKSFVREKAAQTATGAALGAVLTPPVEWATSAVVGAVNGFLNSAKSLGNRIIGMNTPQLQQQLIVNLQQQGIDWQLLSRQVQESLMAEATQAARAGGRLSPEAAARLAEFQSLGIQPIRSWVTRDPVHFSREANLARTQANQEGGALIDAQVAGNRALTDNLNQMGAAQAGSRVAAGERNIGAITGQAAAQQARVTQLYNEAKRLHGGDIPLEARGRLSQVIRELELDGKLPYLGREGDIVNDIISGKLPLTVGRAEGIKSTLAEQMRAAERGAEGGGSRVKALSMVYDALENATPAVPLGQAAQQAYRRARNYAKANFNWQKSTPAVKAALDNVAPDQFFERFILNRGAAIRDVAALRRSMTPELATENRNLIVQHLRDAAAKNAGIDAGAHFSQDAYNKALRQIGPEKLSLFFSPQEIQQLRAIGNAAYNMKNQPVGSSVNNSGTAGALFALLDRFVRMLPAGQALASQPVRNIANQRLESQATNPQFFQPGQTIDPEMARRLLAPLAPAVGAAAAS